DDLLDSLPPSAQPVGRCPFVSLNLEHESLTCRAGPKLERPLRNRSFRRKLSPLCSFLNVDDPSANRRLRKDHFVINWTLHDDQQSGTLTLVPTACSATTGKGRV